MNKFVSTIFSDDVRHEVGGKVTYVGVYGSTMFVQSFPAQLPKLFLTAKVLVPIHQTMANAKLVVYQDDVVIAEVELPPTPEMELPLEEQPENGVIGQSLLFMFCFAPLVLEKESGIRVRLLEEGQEPLKGEGLSIKLAPDGVEFAE